MYYAIALYGVIYYRLTLIVNCNGFSLRFMTNAFS